MVTSKAVDGERMKNHGWEVAFAGMGINLALGVLYTWSVIAGGVPDSWNWSQSDKAWPYSIACLVFCLIMVPAGRMQDRLGPRLVASIGGVLVGVGLVLAGLIGLYMPDHTLAGFVIGFGVLAGAGIGFGYASATPPAVKWFPPAKTGMVAGIVVSGFGLALRLEEFRRELRAGIHRVGRWRVSAVEVRRLGLRRPDRRVVAGQIRVRLLHVRRAVGRGGRSDVCVEAAAPRGRG